MTAAERSGFPTRIAIDGAIHLAAGALAAEYGYGRDYIARLARQGHIVGHQLGTYWYIEEQSFRRFLSRQQDEHAARRARLAVERRREYRAAQSPRGRA